jgi:hypothetical protein
MEGGVETGEWAAERILNEARSVSATRRGVAFGFMRETA